MAAVGALVDRVGTVRVHAPRDAPATRLAVSSAVGSIALPSWGPPTRAILVVRAVDGRAADAGRDPVALAAEVRRQIAASWRSARRPGSGAAGANAIVFRDLTELLAHYLVDLTTGRARECWWWAILHRHLASNGRAADVLAEHIWFAPHVLAEVRRRGRLREVAAALDAEACEQLTEQLADVHAAPALNLALTRARSPRRATSGIADTSGVPVAVRDGITGIDGDARRLFVAAALQLAADPVVARSPAFARDLATLAVERRHAPYHAESAAPEQPGDRQADTGRPGGPVADRTTPAEPVRQSEQPGQGEEDMATPLEPTTAIDATTALDATTPSVMTAGVVRPRGDHVAQLGEPEDSIESPRDESIELDDTEPSDPLEPLAAVEGVATSLGGVFFLIEPLRQFRVAEPDPVDRDLADQSGWWEVLAGFARTLLPPDYAGADDPVWGVLTELGGGQPLDDLLGWLDDVQPVFVAFLTERLGCDLEELAPVLLERPARILSNRTHVDVRLPLSTATVAVRRAGFDLDPGWVPELSRVITFHFDDDTEGQW